ncbi:hypothetical protein BJX99DRAFT_163813 [Aspergillus californicus]
MNVPQASVELGHNQSPQQPQAAGEIGSGRGKTVTSACERCRRRKIRCDGETPCATCRRFRISCVRIQKNDTNALEQRVRQLEALIAEMSSGVSGAPSPDHHAIFSPQSWSPDIRLITDFGSPGPAIAMDQPYGQFLSATSPTIDIPSIQVVDYADSASPISPVSPVAVSPSPSLRSLAPVPPKPMLDNIDSGLRPASTGPTISPPMTACPSPNHSLNPYLSPRSAPGPPRSRSSSISSLNLDAPDWASAPGDILSGLTEADLSMSMFDLIPNSDIEPSWTPTRFEAETLLDKFFDRTHAAGYSPILERSRLFQHLDIIDHPRPPPRGHELSCSVSMARFHVYMAMAIGLRMEKEGRATTVNMLHNCYALAFDEARGPSFWSQPFALEASMFIWLFAKVSSGDSF